VRLLHPAVRRGRAEAIWSQRRSSEPCL
jgi:hypothetical protein